VGGHLTSLLFSLILGVVAAHAGTHPVEDLLLVDDVYGFSALLPSWKSETGERAGQLSLVREEAGGPSLSLVLSVEDPGLFPGAGTALEFTRALEAEMRADGSHPVTAVREAATLVSLADHQAARLVLDARTPGEGGGEVTLRIYVHPLHDRVLVISLRTPRDRHEALLPELRRYLEGVRLWDRRDTLTALRGSVEPALVALPAEEARRRADEAARNLARAGSYTTHVTFQVDGSTQAAIRMTRTSGAFEYQRILGAGTDHWRVVGDRLWVMGSQGWSPAPPRDVPVADREKVERITAARREVYRDLDPAKVVAFLRRETPLSAGEEGAFRWLVFHVPGQQAVPDLLKGEEPARVAIGISTRDGLVRVIRTSRSYTGEDGQPVATLLEQYFTGYGEPFTILPPVTGEEGGGP
jgi:hypothetical protein